MSNKEALKLFNNCVKDFSSTHSDESFNSIQRSLQMLATSNNNIFDPGRLEVAHFFVNLHELMVTLECNSNLTWLCTDVLLEACRNTSGRSSLINTYRFVPILTKYLSSELTTDKKIKLLSLLQELTYGIKIDWQEAQLPALISNLTKWITGNEVELIPLSLGILVNLCYKNAPAVYTLMRTVDTKKFLKSILKLQKCQFSTKLQVSKLFLILEGKFCAISTPDIDIYIRSTFTTLAIALKENDAKMMRNDVNFFKDFAINKKLSHFLESLPDITKLVGKLILSIEDETMVNIECLSILFEFLEVIISLTGNLEVLYLSLLKTALRWVRTEGVGSEAIKLITCITNKLVEQKEIDRDSDKIQENIKNVFTLLEEQITVVLLLMDIPQGSINSCETFIRLAALFDLLMIMIKIPTIAEKLLSELSYEPIQKLFTALKNPDINMFQEPVYTFFIKALCFLTEVAEKQPNWLLRYSELLQDRQVQMILSIAIFTGSKSIKKSAISLVTTPGFRHDCLDVLSSCLTELDKLIIFSPSKTNVNTYVTYVTPVDETPLLTVAQEGHLNNLLDKYEENLKKTDNAVTSAVMELYQFKMAAMGQTLRHMQSGQDAADARVTGLNHSLALIGAEVSRLHQLLRGTQQSLEASLGDVANLKKQINDTECQAKETHEKYSQALQTLKSKTRIINELNEEIKTKDIENKEINKNLKDAYEEIKTKDIENKEINKHIKDANNTISELKNLQISLESSLSNAKEENQLKTTKIESLQKELLNQSEVVIKLKNDNNKFSQESEELKKELLEEKKMREFISELAMGKRKLDK